MRPAFLRCVLGAFLVVSIAGSAGAQQRSPAPSRDAPQTNPRPKVLTGKERLGAKWQDEQRVDNCKVPPDKRGTKPRPDTCRATPSR